MPGILVDPTDPADVAKVAALQDAALQDAAELAGEDFVMPDDDVARFETTRNALLALAAGLASYDRAFGTAAAVDVIPHLLGADAGRGGLPRSEATNVSMLPEAPDAVCRLHLARVPVDAFWSVSVDDGADIGFVHGEPVRPNDIPVPEGWSIVLTLYRPRPEILDGSWTPPPLVVDRTGSRVA